LERVVAYKSDIFFKDAAELALFGNKRGELILTTRRIVFIRTGFGIHTARYDTVEKIERALRERGGASRSPS